MKIIRKYFFNSFHGTFIIQISSSFCEYNNKNNISQDLFLLINYTKKEPICRKADQPNHFFN
ncbi:hypothetical protein BRYFOR_09118 [Marvinbryantia formatexigens DSM 14469]|uniref:Uncharacterized protein n=1 Tax=Marvinbryantia formatexigens DSM 14469 TaxID=478749 RepID=C6LKD2_9FIRM|nr:hypothetical protein BRYFOR_09118 [Marvinbryantia formatexigens DSM 14469]